MKLLVVALLLAPALAAANPQRCRDLAARTFAHLSLAAQTKIDTGVFVDAPEKPWRLLVVIVRLERAPHLARAILGDCPGVVLTETTSIDGRNFRSEVRLRVTSFAALSRLAQLPAVTGVVVVDPTVRINEPFEDFGL